MDENIIVTTFSEDSRAYEAFARLKELAAEDQIDLRDGAVVERVDGLSPNDLRDLAVAVRQQPGVDIVVLVGADSEGSVFSASPPTPCEHPPTSTDAAISTAIRISARLAGRWRVTGEGRVVSCFDTVG